MAMNNRLMRPKATTAAAPPCATPASLLLRFDGGFTDSSANALAVTVNGNAAISTTTKKYGTGGGHFYGGRATLPSSSLFEFDSDFTIEGWFYFTANDVGYQPLVAADSGSDATAWILLMESMDNIYFYGTGGSGWDPALSRSTSYQPPTGEWVHLAVVRSGQDLSVYANGVNVTDEGQPASSGTIASGSTVTVGAYLTLPPINGYIDDLRIVKGLAVYTGPFNPPAAPLSPCATPAPPPPPLSPSTSGWTGEGSVASKLGRATLTGTNANSNTITINNAGLLRITATTSGVGDGTGGEMTIVAGGQTYTGNSGGTGGSWSVDITKTVTVGQTITFASEYADGTFNSLQAWIIPPAAPPAPTSLTSPSQSSGSVYLTWAAPANNGGSAITDYAVQYSSDSGTTWTTFADGTSTALNATVTGLTNGTAYQFRVAGVNSAGTGSYSSTTTATPTAGNSLTASGWSGAGTSASKLAPPASPATFTGSPSITVGTSGTLNVSIVSDDNYNDGWEVIIFRNGTEIYRADGNFNWGSPYTRTFAVTAGQTIALDTSGGGARWFAGTRLWVS